MSLVKAEVRRLFKRRLTRIVLLLVLLVLAAFPIGFTFASKTADPSTRAAAEASAQADFEMVKRDHERMVADCEAAKARGEDIANRFPPDCGESWTPTRDQFTADSYMPYEFSFRDEFPISLYVFSGILAMAMFLIGASFVGAEWHTGGMMNLLLWRPRRLRVLSAKLLVLLGSVLGVFAGLGALWTVSFWALGRFDGTLGRLTSGVWQSLALTGLRGGALVLAAAAIGFGLASLGRHTAMALGAAAGIFVISEIGLQIALQIAQVPFYGRFILSTYATAWFDKKVTLYDYRACEFAEGACNPGEFVLTWQHAGIVFAVGLVLVVGLAFYAMRRRDIT
jgi:ABC-2 type transport system permease protein